MIYLSLIVISAFLDILANLFLKRSQGFQSAFWGALAVILAILAFILLYFTLEYVPLSIAYATWGAVGIIGTCLGGFIFFKERLNFIGILGICLIICAVILMNL